MVFFYKIWKNCEDSQLTKINKKRTKNKTDFNNRKIKSSTPTVIPSYKDIEKITYI